MGFRHGSDSALTVDGVDISAYVDRVDMDHRNDPAEVTALGDDDQAFIAGLNNGTFGMSGHWDGAASASDATLEGTFDGASVSIVYYPGGNVTNQISYTANCLVTNYTVSTDVGARTSWSASFQRTGALTRAVVP